MAEAGREGAPLLGSLRDLKLGAVLALLSNVLALISFLPVLISIPRAFIRVPRQEIPDSIREMLPTLLPVLFSTLILLSAAVTLEIISLYLWYRASDGLRKYDERKFGIGRIGAVIAFAGSLFTLISLIYFSITVLTHPPSLPSRVPLERLVGFFSRLIPGAVLFGVGALLGIIGLILYGVMIMRLSELSNLSPDFKYAGIFLIAGLILSLLGEFAVVGALVEMASLIMIWVYSDSAAKTMSSIQ